MYNKYKLLKGFELTILVKSILDYTIFQQYCFLLLTARDADS